ncbi:MAG: LamB/YcsF family protein [Deinococcus sp.]
MRPTEIRAVALYQLGALSAFLRAEGEGTGHVKAHGALYFRIHGDAEAASAFCRAVQTFAPGSRLMVLAGPAGNEVAAVAAGLGLRVLREAFPERGYADDGLLAARELPGSSVHDPAEAARRALGHWAWRGVR